MDAHEACLRHRDRALSTAPGTRDGRTSDDFDFDRELESVGREGKEAQVTGISRMNDSAPGFAKFDVKASAAETRYLRRHIFCCNIRVGKPQE